MDIVTMGAIKRQHRGHWFDAASMRFFDSRVARQGYRTADGARCFFVSSEQFDPHDAAAQVYYPRLYSVRVMDWTTGSVDTVGEFQAYSSRDEADAAARRLANG